MAEPPRHGDQDDLPVDEPFPGIVRRRIDALAATIVRYEFSAGAAFPLHAHPQEQITLVESGTVLYEAGDERGELGAGGWAVIPGDVPHRLSAPSGEARLSIVIVPRRDGPGQYQVLAEHSRS